MSKKPGILMILSALMLLALAIPGIAQAAVTDQCADGSVDKSFQSSLGQAAQQRIKVANDTLGLFGAIDIQNQYCWQKIQKVMNFAVGISDPMNLVWAAVSGMVMNMLNQLCNAVVSDITQIKNFALSQLNRLCLPKPNFAIGGFGNLGLPNAPTCTGIPLAGPVASPTMTPWATFDSRLMLPTGP